MSCQRRECRHRLCLRVQAPTLLSRLSCKAPSRWCLLEPSNNNNNKNRQQAETTLTRSRTVYKVGAALSCLPPGPSSSRYRVLVIVYRAVRAQRDPAQEYHGSNVTYTVTHGRREGVINSVLMCAPRSAGRATAWHALLFYPSPCFTYTVKRHVCHRFVKPYSNEYTELHVANLYHVVRRS